MRKTSVSTLLTACSFMEATSRYGGYERPQVGKHQVGLFQGSEVPTRRQLAPMNNVVGLLGKRARRRQKHWIGEGGDPGWPGDMGGGGKCLRALQTLAVVNPGRGYNRRWRNIQHDIGKQLLLWKLAPNV